MRKINRIVLAAALTACAGTALAQGPDKPWPLSHPAHRAYFCGDNQQLDGSMPAGYGKKIAEELNVRGHKMKLPQAMADLKTIAACDGMSK